MIGKVGVVISKLIESLTFSRRKAPVDSVASLIEFIETRAVFVAQTSLYGYLKTRMGTRYRDFFEDETYSRSIRVAAVKVAAGAISDLTIFAVAVLAEAGKLSRADAVRLALHCHGTAIRHAFSGDDKLHIPADAEATFALRAGATDWAFAADGENAFAGSPEDLVRYAPVIDEFKDLDREIVTNSIRFRWVEVRDQYRKLLQVEPVLAEWAHGPVPIGEAGA